MGATPKHILVPTDFSDCAERALDYACTLAQKLEATVHVVTAIGDLLVKRSARAAGPFENLIADKYDALEALVRARRAFVTIDTPIVKDADPRIAILEAADDVGADLIVMGTHGRSGIARAFLGSVAEEVVRRAACPVVTVRS
jgi:universal stress protein A